MREDLIARVEEGWRPFRRAVRWLGQGGLEGSTSAGWTRKAMLGHVTLWLDSLVAELPLRLEGRRREPVDVDVANARAASEADARTPHEVEQHLEEAYGRVLAALRALPGDVSPLVVDAVACETYDHFSEHLAELESAIPRTPDELLAALDVAWRRFRAAVRDRGRSGLDAEVRPGWRYRDVVAHAANWNEEATRLLRARGPWDGPSAAEIQRTNERAVAERRLVGAEALLDELDTSHRLLVSAIREAPSEDIAAGGRGVAAFYTYLHWEEHFPDLAIA